MRLGRSLFLGMVVLAVAAGGALYLFRKPIAETMFQRAVAGTVGFDRVAALPDGLHVFVCGSGSPMPDPARAGPCLGVVAGQRVMVFDTGSGGARRLGRMGFPINRLERAYLTHLHSDHFDGLGELLLQAWVGGTRRTPLPVAGPVGVGEVVSGLNAAYRIDSDYRTAHHGAGIADPAGFGGAGEEIAMPDGSDVTRVVLDEGGVRVTAIRVDHAPVESALAYRIDYKGRSIAISGDTKFSPAFVAASDGVDVMFHEALQPEMVKAIGEAADARGQQAIAKVMTDIQDYHTSPEEAARAAAEAKANMLVLYHIVPPLPTRFLNDLFLGDAHKVYSGPIVVGEDGMLFSLAAGADRIQRSRVR